MSSKEKNSPPASDAHSFMESEYKNLSALITHWDSHFWQKSQFFFTVEAALLAGVGVAFKKVLSQVRPRFFGNCAD